MYHVHLRTKHGHYLGLNFHNGVSREVVNGPHDILLRRMRAVLGSSAFDLIPITQGAVEPVAPPPPPPLPPEPVVPAVIEPEPMAKPWAERMAAAKAAKAKAREAK